MKFNKSFLFAALIAGSMALTACNDKEQKPAQQTTQNAQATEAPQVQVDDLVSQANIEFQKVANVQVTNVNVTEDLKSFSITYDISNLSEKAISSLQWLTVYKDNNKPFYVANLPALQFSNSIAPKAKEQVTLSTQEEAVLSQLRPHLQQGKNIQVDIIGTVVTFADGSTVGLTPEAPTAQK